MQTSAMKACFQIAECSKSSAKMMQTSAMKACFQIAECSKSSAKIIRIFDFSAFLVNLNAVPLLYLSFLCHFLLSAEK